MGRGPGLRDGTRDLTFGYGQGSTSANEGRAMSEQNVEFVKGVYGAFARGDVPAVLAAFADDVEWFEAEGMPYGGLYRSGEAVLQNVFGPIAADVEGFAVTPEEYIGSGATVAAIGPKTFCSTASPLR